jgi:hypothetical protein
LALAATGRKTWEIAVSLAGFASGFISRVFYTFYIVLPALSAGVCHHANAFCDFFATA